MKKTVVSCPRCSQGDVRCFVVKRNQKMIWLCDECDALWESGSDVGVKPFVDFGVYMSKFGLSPIWDELEEK